jgi:hypothetical protein
MTLHKLAALRLLSDGLSKFEMQHQPRIERGDHPADVDREIAQAALAGVVTFLLDNGIESQPLFRLLSALSTDGWLQSSTHARSRGHAPSQAGSAKHRRDQREASCDHGISTASWIEPQGSQRLGCRLVHECLAQETVRPIKNATAARRTHDKARRTSAGSN